MFDMSTLVPGSDIQPPFGGDIPGQPSDIPGTLEVLPDGQEALVSGNPGGDVQYNHQQGDNPYGVQNDCGLVSCQDVLNQFGVPVSEADVVSFAAANGLCDVSGTDPSQMGGTSASEQAEILRDGGISAQVQQGDSMSDLASDVDQGKGLIVSVNAGQLWNDPNYLGDGSDNHAVVVTGVARDAESGQILGFYINDSGDGQSKFVDANTMQAAWQNTGGVAVVTDQSVPGAIVQPPSATASSFAF